MLTTQTLSGPCDTGVFAEGQLENVSMSWPYHKTHYCDVIMATIASQITSLNIVYSTVYSGADQRKHQSSASLAFVRGIHRWPVNSPHKWPVTRKMFPFDDVIMVNDFHSTYQDSWQRLLFQFYYAKTFIYQQHFIGKSRQRYNQNLCEGIVHNEFAKKVAFDKMFHHQIMFLCHGQSFSELMKLQMTPICVMTLNPF